MSVREREGHRETETDDQLALAEVIPAGAVYTCIVYMAYMVYGLYGYMVYMVVYACMYRLYSKVGCADEEET